MSNVTIGTDTVAVSKGQTNGTTTTATLAGDSLLFTTVNNADNTIVNQFSIAAGGIFDLIRATFNKGIDSKLAENHMAAGTYTDPAPNVSYGLKVAQGIATDNIFANAYYSKGDFQFELPNGQYMLLQQGSGATVFRGNQTRIVFHDQTPYFRVESWNGGACTVEAAAFNATSDKDKKKNIEKLEVSALDAVKATPVYQYNFIDEEDTAKKRTGLIAQESPEAIVGDNGENKSIDVYAMNAMLWKAVQELTAKVEALEAK